LSSQIERRSLLKAAAISMSTALASTSQKPHIAVIGAGAFGGWTALYLLRNGAKVTLLDAWGPGNSRASSGGETRIIRGTYGPKEQYVHMAARALQLWKENEKRWDRKLFHPTGVLWMTSPDDVFEQASLPLLRAAGIQVEELSEAEARKRYPQINFENVKWCIWERESGFLTARRNCQTVLEHFVTEGGEYREVPAVPGVIRAREMGPLVFPDGSTLRADQYVYACGPWLGKLFPDVIGKLVQPTRQEVFFFGVPAGDPRYSEGQMPTWIDHGPNHFYYGIPGNEWRGFKAADDTRGPACDPTSLERTVSAEGLRNVRNHVEFRFPGLKGAPVVETRVCQYEQTPDENFIIDRHPLAANAWLVGGGSGHGYKHGPAVGELVTQLVLGKKSPDSFFGLARFPL
jgi:monomeric sarcosine oxidase